MILLMFSTGGFSRAVKCFEPSFFMSFFLYVQIILTAGQFLSAWAAFNDQKLLNVKAELNIAITGISNATTFFH